MEFLLAIGGLIIGVTIGVTLGTARSRNMLAGAVARSQYETLLEEKLSLGARLEGLSADKKVLVSSIEQKNQDIAKKEQELRKKDDDMDAMRREVAEARERAVRLQAEAGAQEQRLREQQAALDKMQEQLRLEFKNTAATLFDDISKRFTVQSEKQIGDMLTPLRERLGEFQKMVGESFSMQGREQHTLKSEIEKIVRMNEAMRVETSSLTKALRGDVKAQGNWGEVMLERILEEAGLRKDSDYVLQGTDMGLTGEDGARQRPDVIVKLPEDKHIVIDAKASLTAYDRYCAEADDTQRALHLKDFLKSVKNHVNGLEQRRYQDNEKLGTPDFVLMFMPIEGAYSLAMQQDPELHSFAWGKRIVIVCPSTLFASMRTISSLWRIERQNKNAEEIARQGGALYDKIAAFIDDMELIGTHMNRLSNSYEDAFNKLSRGKGSLLSRAEKLRELDVKSSKSISKRAKQTEQPLEADEKMALEAPAEA